MKSEGLDGFIEAMFQSDERGRLLGNAPHLYVLRTADFVICRCHADLPDALADRLLDIAAAPRGRPSAWAVEYGQYLSALAGFAPVRAAAMEQLYAFPEPSIDDPGDWVSVDSTNARLLQDHLDEWVPDAAVGRPMAAALVEGKAASVCASVRISEKAHCAGVETATPYRRRGLASVAVSRWARLVRSRGAEPFYSTHFTNFGSQAVARHLGLSLIGADFSVTCNREVRQDT